MKLYKTIGVNDETSAKFHWDGTQADAAKRRKELKSSGDFGKVSTEEVDVPTSKAELLAWLNANVTGE